MKERVLDVLMYLFDHCVENEALTHLCQDELIEELEAAGFSLVDIDKAFDWLQGIHDVPKQGASNFTRQGSFRVLNSLEMKKIPCECQSLLIMLEQTGVIDSLTREVILDRTMDLDMDQIRLEHFKWITLMVLVNRDNENSLEWLEEVIFNENTAILH